MNTTYMLCQRLFTANPASHIDRNLMYLGGKTQLVLHRGASRYQLYAPDRKIGGFVPAGDATPQRSTIREDVAAQLKQAQPLPAPSSFVGYKTHGGNQYSMIARVHNLPTPERNPIESLRIICYFLQGVKPPNGFVPGELLNPNPWWEAVKNRKLVSVERQLRKERSMPILYGDHPDGSAKLMIVMGGWAANEKADTLVYVGPNSPNVKPREIGPDTIIQLYRDGKLRQ